jgi:hypothetical protein
VSPPEFRPGFVSIDTHYWAVHFMRSLPPAAITRRIFFRFLFVTGLLSCLILQPSQCKVSNNCDELTFLRQQLYSNRFYITAPRKPSNVSITFPCLKKSLFRLPHEEPAVPRPEFFIHMIHKIDVNNLQNELQWLMDPDRRAGVQVPECGYLALA